MKSSFLFLFIAITFSQKALAQNIAPYWSLSGNSNATLANKIGTTNNVSLRIVTNNKERIKILAGGNVGIGTSRPLARLHVAGTGRFTNSLVVDSGGFKAANFADGGTAVYALADGYDGYGVYAKANAGTGVYGSGLRGVYGLGFTGVSGHSVEEAGIGVEGIADGQSGIGVNGYSKYGTGVVGRNDNYGDGVHGAAKDGWGVLGYSETNAGVEGQSKEGTGVDGLSLNGIGVAGFSSYGTGVQAYSAESYGVYSRTSNPASYAGYFVGNVYATGTYTGSDRSLKEDIADLGSAMDVIGRLKPKSYSFKQEGNYKQMNLPTGKHYGLIAQDVEQVLPQLVKATTFNAAKIEPSKKGTGAPRAAMPQASQPIEFKAVNYTELIPIVIKGMQELHEKNEALQKKTEEIDDLKTQVAELQRMVLDLKNGSNTLTATSAYLEQNSPNPVSGSTVIRYRVPAGAASASIAITNAKGQLVKTMRVNPGSGQVSLNAAALATGTYQYSLLVDGQQAGTRKLVIAR